MDMLASILTLSGLGILFGIGLALAAKKFQVDVDPRIEKVCSILPGVNCGACGLPGCRGFAEALVKGNCGLQRCSVSDEEARKKIADILGIEAKAAEKQVAVLHCNGTAERVKNKFIYKGAKDCIAANLLFGGQKDCSYGCLGFGTCVAVCHFDAIKMSKEGLPVVDENKCRACNRCVEACPKKLFSLIPLKAKVYVSCNSGDLGKGTKAVCPVGCIACKLCEKACKFDAIHVVDNLAVIDYNKCTSCGECVKVCPMKTIRMKE
ncbi:MAG: electron transporter RnfB [Candidatus Omnitrophota bacterium]|nr:MAG: electron transporter RnfB [Candidatus Omnitrophota bacterium]